MNRACLVTSLPLARGGCTTSPDALVFDLRVDPVSRTLHAGTLGRGVWSLQLIEDVRSRNGFER